MASNNSSIVREVFYNNGVFTMAEGADSLLFLLLCSISLFGVVSNIVNLLVYYRLQGGDPININLLGLAVSDFLVCLTTLVLVSLTGVWYVEDLGKMLKVNTTEVFYICIGIPHSIFVRISSMLTALISFERCLCVMVPLKVKTMITSGRVKLSVVVSFLLGLSVAIPNYYANRLKWVHDPILNISILRQVRSHDFLQLFRWFTPIEGVCLHVIPFLTVSVSSIVMARGLKEKMAFRKSATQNESNNVVYKERKVAVMVILMSVIYLVCITPNIVVFLTLVFFPSAFSLRRSGEDMVKLVGFVPILLATLNSSINIVVYYTNSSHYRDTVNKVFWSKKRAKK